MWLGLGSEKLLEDLYAQELDLSKPDQMLVRLEQKAGDVVCVPPGWLHAVFTQKASVKVAYDVVVPEHLPHYVAAWKYVGSQLHIMLMTT